MAYQSNDNNRNSGNNSRHDKRYEAPQITLDYEVQTQLFGEVAQKWSEKLAQEKTHTKNTIHQIRGFYDKVMELNVNTQNTIDDEQYIKEVYPFVIMLNSKVAYAKSRDLVSDTFVKMINQCVQESTSVKKMANFKLFFEAFIGFYPKK